MGGVLKFQLSLIFSLFGGYPHDYCSTLYTGISGVDINWNISQNYRWTGVSLQWHCNCWLTIAFFNARVSLELSICPPVIIFITGWSPLRMTSSKTLKSDMIGEGNPWFSCRWSLQLTQTIASDWVVISYGWEILTSQPTKHWLRPKKVFDE